jgi:hypothetical protein
MLTKTEAPHLLLRVAANVACVVIWAAVIGIILLTLAGCMTGSEYALKINPATGEGTATLVKTALVEPLTGTKISEADVRPPEEGGGWLGLVGLALTAVGGLQLAGPKSWANWAAVLKPSTSWRATGHALAANLALAHTPKEAKSNETQRPVPDRTET